DFRVATLKSVLAAFPHTPINVEIKGRTKQEAISEYLTNADALARLLRNVRRKNLIVVSFKQPAVDRFHSLVPGLPLAPGVDGEAGRVPALQALASRAGELPATLTTRALH